MGELILPTPAKLQADTMSIAQQIHDCWDGEVQCLVVLIPKDSKEIFIASTIPSFDRLKAVWRAVQEKLHALVNLRGRA